MLKNLGQKKKKNLGHGIQIFKVKFLQLFYKLKIFQNVRKNLNSIIFHFNWEYQYELSICFLSSGNPHIS